LSCATIYYYYYCYIDFLKEISYRYTFLHILINEDNMIGTSRLLRVIAFFVGFLSLAIASFENEIDFEVGAEGDISSFSSSETSISVHFQNTFSNDTLILFWISETAEYLQIGEIEALSSISINSYGNHVFAAKPKTQNMTVSPRVVSA
jgi:hypothetical protein